MKLNWNMLSKYRNQLYALSILWIFVFHVNEYFGEFALFKRIPEFIVKRGNTGVDIFLFLSGVSMYYAMKKSTGLSAFYRRRYYKVVKIYLCFCVPFFTVYYLTGKMSFDMFVKQLTFTKSGVSSFWFLLCILICYTFYPAIYRLLCENRIKMIRTGVLLYILGLVWLNSAYPQVFSHSEILTTRIPVFVMGSLAGRLVYEKKEIPTGFLFLMLLCLTGKDMVSYLYHTVPVLEANKRLIARLFGGIQGIGMIFFMIIFLQYLAGTAAERFLSWFGQITLEFYVVHIAVKHILFIILGIQAKNSGEVAVLSAIWLALSISVSVLLHHLLYRPRAKNSAARPLNQGKSH